jgi:predicted nucleic acid-binding protein
MDPSLRYLIDTNVLLRLSRQDDPQHQLIATTIEALGRQGADLCFAIQNVAEFWNVFTRPAERNGYGPSVVEANQRVDFIERTMTFLPDNEQVYSIWRHLVVANNVCGVQVHDARLAAIMQAHGVARILTLNESDFLCYAGIQAVHPNRLQPSPS